MKVVNQVVRLFFQISSFVGFVAHEFKLLYLVLFLTGCVLVLEYAATSLMIPMAPGHDSSQGVVSVVWRGLAESISLPPTFRTWLWLFFFLMAVRLALGYMLTVLTTYLGKQVHERLSARIFGHILLSEPMARVYTRSIGHYITLAGDDTFKSGTIVASLLQSFVGFLTAMIGLLVLYQFSSSIFFGVLVFLGCSLVLIGSLIGVMMKLNATAVTLSREAGTTFVEAFNSLRSIRALHSERFVMSSYANHMHNYVRKLVQMDAIKSGVKAFPAIVLLLLSAIALRPAAQVDMTDAALFAGTVIVIRVFASLGQMKPPSRRN